MINTITALLIGVLALLKENYPRKKKILNIIIVVLMFITSISAVFSIRENIKIEKYSRQAGAIDGSIEKDITAIQLELSNSLSFIISDNLKTVLEEKIPVVFPDGLKADYGYLDIWLDGEKIRISTTIYDSKGEIVAQMDDNAWKVRPDKVWDFNFDDNGIEILNSMGDVVLQIIKKDYSFLPNGTKMVTLSFRGVFLQKNGWTVALGGTPEINGSYLQTIGPNSDDKINFEKVFKYPSSLYPGERLSQ